MRRALQRGIAALAAVAATAVAAPALAGTYYIPIEARQAGDETWVWLANSGPDGKTWARHLILPGTDGTQRSGPAERRALPGNGTFFFKTSLAAGETGLLEIDAEPGLLIDARLVRAGQPVSRTTGVAVPVIGSREAAAPYAAQSVLSLQKGSGVASNFRFINLGHQAANCTAALIDTGGRPLAGSPFDFGVDPLSLHTFDDVLGHLGLHEETHLRAIVGCDQPHFSYATVTDGAAGRTLFVPPAAEAAASLFQPPGQGGGGSGGGGGAGGGGGGTGGGGGGGGGGGTYGPTTTWTAPGVFHAPTPGNRLKRLAYQVPAGNYKRLHLNMQIEIGPWQNPTNGLHSVFWLALERNKSLYGFTAVRGPGNPLIMVRHGIGMTQPFKSKVLKSYQFQPGQTYTFDFVYDTLQRKTRTKVWDQAGNLVLDFDSAKPNVNTIKVLAGQRFLIDFGFTGVNPQEPPTYGWKYKNLTFEVTK